MSHSYEEHLKDRDVVDGPVTYRFYKADDDNSNHSDLSWLGELTDKTTFPYYDRRQSILVVGSYQKEVGNPEEGESDEVTVYHAFELNATMSGDEVYEVTDYNPEDAGRSSREYNFIGGFQCPPKDAKDLDGIKACLLNAKRLEEYEKGYWSMTGVACRVFVTPVTDDADGEGEPIQISDDYSYALWGIESDCGDAYVKEVCDGLMADAKDSLAETISQYTESGARRVKLANVVMKHLGLPPIG